MSSKVEMWAMVLNRGKHKILYARQGEGGVSEVSLQISPYMTKLIFGWPLRKVANLLELIDQWLKLFKEDSTIYYLNP